jgi:maltooligosyltrehalose synthase
LTAPGIPDLYQGTEFWDFSLVDPDNRGAVDFAARQEALAAPARVDDLMRNWQDGRLKQWLIARVLQFRKRHDRLFAAGSYEPVTALGPASTHLIAFIRRYGGEAVLVLATRHGASFLGAGDLPRIESSHWRDTVLQLPMDLREMRPHDALNDRPREDAEVAMLLSTLPVAVCHFMAR